jgi:hypothetical protein
VIVGDEGDRMEYRRNMAAAAAAPAPAKADRAMYYATKGGAHGGARAKKDLVGAFSSGAMDPDAVAPAALPEDLRGMDKPALKAELTKRAEARKAAQEELTTLAKQREEYLKAQAKDGEGGFDAKVKAAIDLQLK